jgi:hypothetical protein
MLDMSWRFGVQLRNGVHLWLDQGLYEIIPDGHGAQSESSTASSPGYGNVNRKHAANW